MNNNQISKFLNFEIDIYLNFVFCLLEFLSHFAHNFMTEKLKIDTHKSYAAR